MNRAGCRQAEEIKNLSVEELDDRLAEMGLEKYRLAQILGWLYNKGVTGWDAMTNLRKSLRADLAEHFSIGILEPATVQVSEDSTRKYLFELEDGLKIESVLIPDGKRKTLCISSQVGCAMGCRFCYTGELGFTRNLDVWEIIEQVLAVRRERPASEAPTNIVFMGMGEPLLNYDNVIRAVRLLVLDEGLNFSSRHITISTVGIPDLIDRLARQATPLNLAVSLNAPDDDLRSAIMPVNRRYPLDKVFAALDKFPLPSRRRITFEYIMLKDLNDDELTARRLANRVKRIPCKVNLIPFNSFPGCDFKPSPPEVIERFQALLRSKHISAFIRESRGADIMAACGQLAAR